MAPVALNQTEGEIGGPANRPSGTIGAPTDPGSKRPRRAAYLWLILGLPLIVLLLAFPLARTDWFLHHNDYPPLRSVGFGDRLEQANCQIVIFGDSTAQTGLEPSIIEQTTGLSTCNIAEVMPVISLNGFAPLDHYLRNNRAPMYLVFMFLPRDFHGVPPWTEPVEGAEYLLRYDLNPDSLGKLVRYSDHSFEFAQWAWRGVVTDFFRRAARGLPFVAPKPTDRREDPVAERDRRKGAYNPFDRSPDSAEKTSEKPCLNAPTEPPLPAQAAWVEEARRRYQVGGTTVIFDAAPVPDCLPHLGVYETNIAGLHDNPFEVLPVSMFSDWMHVGPAGSAVISKWLGDRILAIGGRGRMASPPAR